MGAAWPGPDDSVSPSISEFGEVLDLVLLMDYDVNNPLAGDTIKYSSSVAPLRSDGCTDEETQWNGDSLETAV